MQTQTQTPLDALYGALVTALMAADANEDSPGDRHLEQLLHDSMVLAIHAYRAVLHGRGQGLVSRPESSLILTAQSPVGVDDRLGVLRPCEGLRLFVVDADEPMNLVA